MAKLEVSVSYKTVSAHGLILFSILWLLFGCLLAKLWFPAMLVSTWAGDNLILEIFLAILMVTVSLAIIGAYLFVPCLLFASFSEGNRIMANKEGLTFPALVGRGLGFKHSRKWSDVEYVSISTPDPSNISRKDTLLIKFRSGGYARLKLWKLDPDSLEQLLLALEMFAPGAERSVDLTVFYDTLQNLNHGTELSYTQLWEEELGRRFNSTNFIPLSPGTVLKAEYTVARQMAFGGFSAIYLATAMDGQSVVVKEFVLDEHATDTKLEKARQLFRREAELLFGLDHERIASVIERFEDGDREYMVMEYIPGQNLRQLVSMEGPQSEETLIRWVRQIAQILVYLHEHDPPIVHRDLTPDNLVVSDKGEIFLIDFGAANEFMSCATGTLIGKQNYISPEQVRGKASPSSDLFSLGATMHYLLTGNDPRALATSRPSTSSATVSGAMDDIVARLTCLDESNRIGSARALLDELSRLPAATEEGAFIDIRKNQKVGK